MRWISALECFVGFWNSIMFNLGLGWDEIGGDGLRWERWCKKRDTACKNNVAFFSK